MTDNKAMSEQVNSIVDEKREEVYVSAALDAPLAKYLSTLGPLYFSYPRRQQNFALLSTLENAEGTFNVAEEHQEHFRKRCIDLIINYPPFVSDMDELGMTVVDDQLLIDRVAPLDSFLRQSGNTKFADMLQRFVSERFKLCHDKKYLTHDNVLDLMFDQLGMNQFTVKQLKVDGFLDGNEQEIRKTLELIIQASDRYDFANDDLLNLVQAMYSITEFHSCNLEILILRLYNANKAELETLWKPDVIVCNVDRQSNHVLLALLLFLYPKHQVRVMLHVSSKEEFLASAPSYQKFKTVKSLEYTIKAPKEEINCRWNLV